MMIEGNKKILVVGASGDLGFAVFEMLVKFDLWLGVHCFHNKKRLEDFIKRDHRKRIKIFVGDLSGQKNCQKLVQSFVRWAGGINGLVQLSGSVENPKKWDVLDQKCWDRDIAVNLTGPFFLAREAMKHMIRADGGKIILASTASVPHGGGRNSMAYGSAKAGIEYITKGLAREGAKHKILVNAVAPGFIDTKFHRERMQRSEKQLKERAQLVLLRRAGKPEDIANMITYLLSPAGNFITGQVLTISGGDWL